MKKILITISLLGALCSCCHDDDENEDKVARKTVFVYMAAENNLASYADDDLMEMKEGSKSLAKDQNLVVYVDRAGSSTTPYLARIYNGELVDTLFMPEGLAADPTVLRRTIAKAKELYPAKSYGLMVWGHASGWLISESDSISPASSRAYGGSTGNNSSYGSGKYWMNIPEMAEAIAGAMGNDKLQFIFGDCCSFACLEVAYELRNVTDYVIGSPAEVPDMGAPFELSVPDMFVDSNDYSQLIDNYYNYYIEVFQTKKNSYYNRTPGDLAGYSLPLAIVKTSELDNLATATAHLLNTMAEKVSTSGSLSLENTINYAMYSSYRYSYDVCSVLKENATAANYETWKAVFDKAVPHKRYSAKWMSNISQLVSDMEKFNVSEEDCGCISMFFPGSIYAYTKPNWNKAIQKYQWDNIIHWAQYGW